MIDPLGRLAARAPASFNWSLHGVQLSARIRAAGDSEFGGDWCEAFPVSQGVIALSIGDVRGHGEEKYATMVAMRGALRAAALCGLDPAQALAEAHDFLRVYDPEDFATAILAFLHVARRRVSFAIAGHPPPLHCSATGAVYLDAGSYDVPLGIPSGAPPVRHDVQLSCASLLVFYTDGVPERARQPLNGQAELRDAGLYAYAAAGTHTARVIEQQMQLTGANGDDVAILTAWLPEYREIAGSF